MSRELRVLTGAESVAHSQPPRFASTPGIDNDAAVKPLAPVRTSMRREQIYRWSLACADGLAAITITLTAAALWGASPSWLFVGVPVIAVLVSKVQGLYDRDDMVLLKSTIGEWRDVLRTSALITMGTYFVWWLSTSPAEGRGLHLFGFLLTGMFALQLSGRAVARHVAQARTSHERCLVVGSPAACSDIAQRLSAVPTIDVVGTIPDEDIECSVAGVHGLARQMNVERIIVVPHTGWSSQDVLNLIQSAKWLGVRVSLMPTILTVVGASTTIEELDSMVLLGVPRFGLSRSSAALKRVLDLVGAGATLVLTAPLLALIALAIKRDSEGPALFRQQRIGRDGRPFTMYKFRSMIEGADRMKSDLDVLNETDGLFKLAEDPRITYIGRFLRRTYLDELPQLINVVRGDMSLVGPRPLIESEDALLTGYDRHRSRLTPGMTGPWQLRGPLDASLAELVKLDYMYASSWSVWTDMDVLLGTLARVVFRRGQ